MARPDQDVRIDVRWLHVLRDVSEQYVAPPHSVRLLLNYVHRLGVREAALKVRSRLAERGRSDVGLDASPCRVPTRPMICGPSPAITAPTFPSP